MIKLELEVQEINCVLQGLCQMPYAQVNALIAKIQQQAQPQPQPQIEVPQPPANETTN